MRMMHYPATPIRYRITNSPSSSDNFCSEVIGQPLTTGGRICPQGGSKKIAAAVPILAELRQARTVLRAHALPMRIRARGWALGIPPLYTVTAAAVGGDAFGNIISNRS